MYSLPKAHFASTARKYSYSAIHRQTNSQTSQLPDNELLNIAEFLHYTCTLNLTQLQP